MPYHRRARCCTEKYFWYNIRKIQYGQTTHAISRVDSNMNNRLRSLYAEPGGLLKLVSPIFLGLVSLVLRFEDGNTLNRFRLVPDSALIFVFSTTGNLSGIEAPLARGEASVKDMNSMGKTPLVTSSALFPIFEIKGTDAFYSSLQKRMMCRFANFS